MDIDMLGRVSNTVENLEQIVRACATVEVDADGVEFDPQSVRGEVIVKGKAYEGVRTRLRGTLGKIKLNVQLDFGFGESLGQSRCGFGTWFSVSKKALWVRLLFLVITRGRRHH